MKTIASLRKEFVWMAAVGALGLSLAGAGRLRAQGQGAAAAPGQAPAAPRGNRFANLPRQGFEATGQNPANYTPAEAAAVAVVQKWIETSNSHDVAAHMALVDDNVVYRPDPTSALARGARGYCAAFGFVRMTTSILKIDEMYVVGGPADALVLIKRTDINMPAGSGRGGGLAGYPVPLAVLVRVRSGKVTEWYDAPLNKVSGGAMRSVGAFPPPAPPAQPRPVPEVCMQYPEGQGTAASAAATAPAQEQPHEGAQAPLVSYGTSKPEFWFNPDEESAAQAVRAWFAAWQAGNPLLLGAFVDQNVIFRAKSSDDLGHGRDNLLRLVCGSIGGRLNLTGLYVVGGDYDTGVIASWDKYDAAGNRTRMGSFFRVQKGLITEWMDSQVDGGPAMAANQNSAACQAVNAALPPAAGPETAAAQPAGR